MESDLEKLLHLDSSRAVADLALRNIGNDPALFGKAFELMMRDEYPLSMRAARVVDECAEADPSLMEPYLEVLLEKMDGFRVEGIRRSILRYFVKTKTRLSPSLQGYLVDRCFRWLGSATASVAVRHYSMEILYRFAIQQPGIRQELTFAIEDALQHNLFTAGDRPRHYLRALRREMNPSRREPRS